MKTVDDMVQSEARKCVAGLMGDLRAHNNPVLMKLWLETVVPLLQAELEKLDG